MKSKLLLTFITLTLLAVPQAVFAQSDVDVGGTVLESPGAKIQEPVIGPPRAATKPSGAEKRTTVVQIPDEEGGLPFYRENKDFLLGTIFGLEILMIILLIFLLRRKKKTS